MESSVLFRVLNKLEVSVDSHSFSIKTSMHFKDGIAFHQVATLPTRVTGIDLVITTNIGIIQNVAVVGSHALLDFSSICNVAKLEPGQSR